MQTPPIVSSQQWQAAWEQMLAKEKALTHARDALAAWRLPGEYGEAGS